MAQLRPYETEEYKSVMDAQTISTVSTLYNGSSGTVAGIDTQGYDGVTLIVNTGTFTGAATVDVQFMTSPTADSTYATAISSASINSIDSASDNTIYKGYYQSFKGDRYLFVRTAFKQTALAGTAPLSVTAVLDRYQKRPITDKASLSFCVDESV